ncbi:Uncharacterised protein [Salmonella enterica subsp. enterica]|nr:Uncharacterised protein [Salmonella enterica subsp. enterica]
MENHNSHIAEFISLFSQTARYHYRYKVVRDFTQQKQRSFKQTEVRVDE